MSQDTEESERDSYVRRAKEALQRADMATRTAEQAAGRMDALYTDAIQHGYLMGSPEHDRALGMSHIQMAHSRQIAAAYGSIATTCAILAQLVDVPSLLIPGATLPNDEITADLTAALRERIEQHRNKGYFST